MMKLVVNMAGPVVSIVRASVGDESPWGTVGLICEGGDALNGLFACITHGIASFPNGAKFRHHCATDERHLVVWRCRAHGPEGFGKIWEP